MKGNRTHTHLPLSKNIEENNGNWKKKVHTTAINDSFRVLPANMVWHSPTQICVSYSH